MKTKPFNSRPIDLFASLSRRDMVHETLFLWPRPRQLGDLKSAMGTGMNLLIPICDIYYLKLSHNHITSDRPVIKKRDTTG